MPNDCRLKISTLEDIWDILLVGCVSLDAHEASWTKSNEFTSEFLGYSDVELRGKRLSSVTAPSDWEVESKAIDSILSGFRDSYTLSKQFLAKDGRHRWARVQANKITPEDDVPFLVYQIVPGEIEVLQAASNPTQMPEPPKTSAPLLTFVKNNWKNLIWMIGSGVMLIAKGYHSIETWRLDQETKVESLNQDIREVKETAENNQDKLDLLNSNIEILIKSLDK